MWTYWLMFALPAIAAFAARGPKTGVVGGVRSTHLDPAWMSVIVVLTLLIGYRFEVGGDWLNYFRYLNEATGVSLTEVLSMSDPGYRVLNWLSAEMDWGIYGVNLIGGAIFSMGLAVFCRSLPRPWLALALAVPYVVIVVAMGYSRQGIALGLAMLGLVALGRGATPWFVLWVVLGATFHKSAVLLLPIAALAATRNRYWTAAWVAVAALAAYKVLLEESANALYQNYIEAEYQSEGALIRSLMNALPAMILLLLRKRFRFVGADRRLWLWFAAVSIGLLGVLFATSATTAVDRMALYMLPLQLVVFAHFPEVFGSKHRRNEALVMAVLLYYAAVEFVWLNYADHAYAWLPYRFYPLESWS